MPRENPRKFAELLVEGIAEIKRHESKLIKDIHEELGAHIGRGATTITYFRRGEMIPASMAEIEELAIEVSRRSYLGSKWVEDLLSAANHPNPSRVLARVQRPEEQHDVFTKEQKQKPVIYLNSPTDVSELSALSEQQRHDIVEARAVDALGINLWRLLPAYQDEFLEMLRHEGMLRILMVHYNSAAIPMAALRSYSGTPAKTQADVVRQNLELLKKWTQRIPNANIRVRLLDYLPPYGITVIYPKGAGRPPHCLVRLNAFKKPTSKSPSMTPNPRMDKHWFDFFCEQFQLMWDAGENFDLTTL